MDIELVLWIVIGLFYLIFRAIGSRRGQATRRPQPSPRREAPERKSEHGGAEELDEALREIRRALGYPIDEDTGTRLPDDRARTYDADAPRSPDLAGAAQQDARAPWADAPERQRAEEAARRRTAEEARRQAARQREVELERQRRAEDERRRRTLEQDRRLRRVEESRRRLEVEEARARDAEEASWKAAERQMRLGETSEDRVQSASAADHGRLRVLSMLRTEAGMRDAFILSEIIGPPKALRKKR